MLPTSAAGPRGRHGVPRHRNPGVPRVNQPGEAGSLLLERFPGGHRRAPALPLLQTCPKKGIWWHREQAEVAQAVGDPPGAKPRGDFVLGGRLFPRRFGDGGHKPRVPMGRSTPKATPLPSGCLVLLSLQLNRGCTHPARPGGYAHNPRGRVRQELPVPGLLQLARPSQAAPGPPGPPAPLGFCTDAAALPARSPFATTGSPRIPPVTTALSQIGADNY